jgi:ribonuclease VapC
MVIDSSALIAIVLGEPERRPFIEAIAAADVRLVAAPTMFEASIVALARSDARLRDLRAFCERGEVETVAFGPDHIDLALDAFRRYGKGRHPAALNMGDCFSYALAKATAEPLLFKGDDFSQTDIKRAV